MSAPEMAVGTRVGAAVQPNPPAQTPPSQLFGAAAPQSSQPFGLFSGLLLAPMPAPLSNTPFPPFS